MTNIPQVLGQQNSAGSQSVVRASDELPMRCPIPGFITGQTLIRPANVLQYSLGQMILNNTVLGNVTIQKIVNAAKAVDEPFIATHCRIEKSTNVITNAIFRVHFFGGLPVPVTADRTAFAAGITGPNYFGSFEVTCGKSFSDPKASGFGTPSDGPFLIMTPASGTRDVYYVVEARAAYTPGSAENITASLAIL